MPDDVEAAPPTSVVTLASVTEVTPNDARVWPTGPSGGGGAAR
eukprot:gene33610-45010_t